MFEWLITILSHFLFIINRKVFNKHIIVEIPHSTITSHASYLIKTPIMYLIT